MTTKKIIQISLMLIFIFSMHSVTHAQSNQFTISGRVIDNDLKVPLEYSTVSITSVNDPSYLNGGVTDVNGNFAIEVPSGTYNIKIEFISYESKTFNNRKIDSNTDLGTIQLGFSSANLDEVVVVSETTQVEVHLDKKIYNIGKDLTTAGATINDVLNNVPSVSVDVEGSISLRGNENVKILINGKPSAMAGFGGNNVLGQLPADAIERVEVITSPSARYDAEGTAGILNIILRKEKILGFNGSLTTNVGSPESYGITANVNYRSDKFNIFNTSGFNYRNSPGYVFSDTHYSQGSFGRVVEDRDMQRLGRRFNTNFGAEYFINDKSSITASTFFNFGNDDDITTNFSDRYQGNELVQKTIRREAESEDDRNSQYSLNYINRFNDKGHQLTADFQYENDKEKKPTFVSEIATLDITPDGIGFLPSEYVYTEETQNEYLIQTDYVLPFGKDSQFEAGYRGNFKNEVTDYTLRIENEQGGELELSPLTNVFDYTENVNALYSQYGTKYGKFSFLLGLRMENTQLKGKINTPLTDEQLLAEFGFPIETNFDKNYLGLFPTLNLIYELGEKENITLGYNRRINRPRGWYINPFPSRSSRTNIYQGNPNLNPAYSSAIDLGYLKRWEKLTLTSSLYYNYETDAFERVQQGTGQFFNDIEIIRSIPINLATDERIGFETGVLYNPLKWLRLNGSFNFFQYNTKGEFNGIDYGAKNNSWFASFSSKVTLPAKIEWQTNANYRGPSENSQTKSEGIFSLDLAFSREIFKDNATLSVNARDLLNSRKRNSFTETESFTQQSEFQWRQRQITLSLTYRFNQQKKEQDRKKQNNGNGEDGDFEG